MKMLHLLNEQENFNVVRSLEIFQMMKLDVLYHISACLSSEKFGC